MLDKQNSKCLSSNVCLFGRGFILLQGQPTKIHLKDNHFVLKSFKNIDKQNVLVKQCLSLWPNVQASNSKCLSSNVCLFGRGFILLQGQPTKIHLKDNHFVLKSFKNIDKQNVLVKQCLSLWPNVQASNSKCLSSNVCLFGRGFILSQGQPTKIHLKDNHFVLLSTQFGTQVKFRWSRDHNNRTADNAFSASWYYSEMKLEPVTG